MGNSAFLQKPITDKITTFIEDQSFRTSICEMQGWRRYMEDSYIASLKLPGFQHIALFGVFDGHGGAQSSKYVAKHFVQYLVKRPTLKQGKIGQALTQTFINVQLMMKMPPAIKQLIQYKKQVTKLPTVTEKDLQSGCTAIVVAVTKDKIICANAGDSRASLCRLNSVQPLSEDHKPQNPTQKQRIQKSGVPIVGGRVNGLNLTRSIGDFSHKTVAGLPFHKQPITCMPDIRQFNRQKTDEFLLLGCDGIWQNYGQDFIELTQQLRNDFKEKQKNNLQIQRRGTQVLKTFFDKNVNPNNASPYGRDNMTAIIVQFKN